MGKKVKAKGTRSVVKMATTEGEWPTLDDVREMVRAADELNIDGQSLVLVTKPESTDVKGELVVRGSVFVREVRGG